jgi:hypothetical protein
MLHPPTHPHVLAGETRDLHPPQWPPIIVNLALQHLIRAFLTPDKSTVAAQSAPRPAVSYVGPAKPAEPTPATLIPVSASSVIRFALITSPLSNLPFANNPYRPTPATCDSISLTDTHLFHPILFSPAPSLANSTNTSLNTVQFKSIHFHPPCTAAWEVNIIFPIHVAHNANNSITPLHPSCTLS